MDIKTLGAAAIISLGSSVAKATTVGEMEMKDFKKEISQVIVQRAGGTSNTDCYYQDPSNTDSYMGAFISMPEGETRIYTDSNMQDDGTYIHSRFTDVDSNGVPERYTSSLRSKNEDMNGKELNSFNLSDSDQTSISPRIQNLVEWYQETAKLLAEECHTDDKSIIFFK